MNHLTPEPEQREYIERCKKATEDLKKERPHTAEELLKMRDDKLRQAGVCIPQYERGD
jgi:hypothetical protein